MNDAKAKIMNDMRVLVTGGSGFIGSKVVEKLLTKGTEVINLDVRPPARAEQETHWRNCDVRDPEAVHHLMASFDPHFVLHLASDIDVTLTQLEDYQTTIDGTANVVAAVENLRHLRRFVHVSTQFVVTPGIQPKDETDFHPYTLYGEAKARSEVIVRTSAIDHWLILRPAIIWGPGHPSFGEAIWKYIANGRYLHPSAKTPIHRCYGYVRNTAEQMIAFLEADLSGTSKRVFYLGDGSIDHDLWADGFAYAFRGKPAKRVPKQLLWVLASVGEVLRLTGIRFPMDMGRYFRMTTSAEVDLEPTFEIVGHPSISLDQGITETIAWLEQAKPGLFGASRPEYSQSQTGP